MTLNFRVVSVILSSIITFSTLQIASAQIVWLGIKAGVQVTQPKIDDIHFKDTVKTIPSIGYNVGAVLLFKIKDRYFLHSEYLYSMKSKINQGKVDHLLWDKVTYHYFEVPILFTMQFKVRLGKEKNFKWYAGVGPNIAYLLNGSGVIKSGELIENYINSLSYKINFTQRPDRNFNELRTDQIYYPSVNRFQFGLNFGTGILLEPAPKQKIIVDLRYTTDQTLFGKKSADYLIPDDYNDNLKVRSRSLRFSVIYMFEYNLDKKARKKGKSTLKKSAF